MCGCYQASAFCILEVFHIAKLEHQLNEEIRDKEIRVIGADGAQLGIMSSADAQRMAYEKDMDLVNQRVVEVKEVRMSPNIDTNDFNVKLKNAQKFLKEGNRVKVTVRFRGREMAHTSIGEVLLKQFGEQCAEVATVEKNPKLDGRHMTMFLSPKAAK